MPLDRFTVRGTHDLAGGRGIVDLVRTIGGDLDARFLRHGGSLALWLSRTASGRTTTPRDAGVRGYGPRAMSVGLGGTNRTATKLTDQGSPTIGRGDRARQPLRFGRWPRTRTSPSESMRRALQDRPRTKDVRTRERETSAARNGRQAGSRRASSSLTLTNHVLQSDTRPGTSMRRARVPDRPIRLQLRSPVFHARRREDPCSLRAKGGVDGDRPPEHTP